MLQVTWNYNKEKEEILAYDMIGRMHFYRGNLERAKYYSNRCKLGLTEVEHSKMKMY